MSKEAVLSRLISVFTTYLTLSQVPLQLLEMSTTSSTDTSFSAEAGLWLLCGKT